MSPLNEDDLDVAVGEAETVLCCDMPTAEAKTGLYTVIPSLYSAATASIGATTAVAEITTAASKEIIFFITSP